MDTSQRSARRALLNAGAATVVVLAGLYLIVVNAQQQSVPGVAIASLQVIAGGLLLGQALRQRGQRGRHESHH